MFNEFVFSCSCFVHFDFLLKFWQPAKVELDQDRQFRCPEKWKVNLDNLQTDNSQLDDSQMDDSQLDKIQMDDSQTDNSKKDVLLWSPITEKRKDSSKNYNDNES